MARSRSIGLATAKDTSKAISSNSSSFRINNMNKMICEHPTCTLEANTICKQHCHLSVCPQHRVEHEKKFLNEFEKQLDRLSNPISTLLNQYRSELKDSEDSRQRELDQINSLFNSHFTVLDQRSQLSKTTNELISNKRDQLIKYENGDHQLTKEDYRQVQNLVKQVQNNLQQQYQFNNQILDGNSRLDSCSIENNQTNNESTEIECIEISDSDDAQSEMSTDIVNVEDETTSLESTRMEICKKQGTSAILVRDYCPLTQLGVFGLKSSHNLARLCSKSNNRQRYLYFHFTQFHRIKSTLANQMVKAIRDGHDPMKTKIFPQNSTEVMMKDISCPFDATAVKFNRKNSIPNTPCTASLNCYYFKHHLQTVHSITKLNASLILKAMKTAGTISHVQFEEDLCEIKK